MPKSPLIPGFEFSGISCGIKATQLPDLALISSTTPATAVGLFTSNRVKAAPVLVSTRNIRGGLCSAVIINSGNANACTGAVGKAHAGMMVAKTAAFLKVPQRQVLVCSTGKIGVPLPIDRILQGIPRLIRAKQEGSLRRAARAILTTDDSIKLTFEKGEIDGRPFHLAGFAKGAGMIEPHLGHATMLAFFMTDVRIDQKVAAPIFARAAEQTFNRITVDGDTSTNDTALLLANGQAGNRPLRAGSKGAARFEATLTRAMERLALMMVEDGEGGTKLVALEVRGARNDREARKIAYAVANSPLVKTSFYGGDPNWGRLLAAAGRGGATLAPQRTDIYYGGVCVTRKGLSTGRSAELKAKKVMKKPRFEVTIDLHLGQGRFRVWTSDLTLDYVKLNSVYRT